MALKKEQKNTEVAEAPLNLEKVTLNQTMIHPRITEKATDLASNSNAYVFDVVRSATKKDISRAVASLYNVTPVKIRTVPVKSKTVFVRGKYGQTARGKKAYVYLKKGDSIEFV
jgi:large subunit ribosomal protein L23